MSAVPLAVPAAGITPDARLLFVINLVTVLAVVLFASGVVFVLLRRSYRRRVEEQKLAAMGTATARILHQIKNPLQTILLHADLLQDPAIADRRDSRAEVCDAITGEAQRLAAMLAELSSYASGAQRRLSREPFPLHALLHELARRESREAWLEVDASEVAEAEVQADGYYLRQAVENLISNARDAMRGQPVARLRLGLQVRDEWAVVTVGDTGPGIAPERLRTIFEPFVSGKTKGMGLGLAICREIVEGHGGRVEVHSRVGQGTTFRLLLPLHRGEGARPRALAEEGVC